MDMFDVIKKLNSGDLNAYDAAPPELQKSLAPFTILRFMCGTNDKTQIVQLEHVVNRYIFSANKELAFKLLAIGASRRVSFCKFLPLPALKDSDVVKIVAMYYECSMREAQLMMKNITDVDIELMKEELGIQEEEKPAKKKGAKK